MGWQGTEGLCHLLVVYEDIPTRDLAIQLCVRLAGHFGDELDFDVSWWELAMLADPATADEAVAAALRADVLLVCVHNPRDLPVPVVRWFELWTQAGRAAPGALVFVRTAAGGLESRVRQDDYFKSVAQRANLDYLVLQAPELHKPALMPERAGTAPGGADWAEEWDLQSPGSGINE